MIRRLDVVVFARPPVFVAGNDARFALMLPEGASDTPRAAWEGNSGIDALATEVPLTVAASLAPITVVVKANGIQTRFRTLRVD